MVELNEETLVNRMKACLTLQSHYRDMLRSIKDALGATYGMSAGTSLSSLGPASSIIAK